MGYVGCALRANVAAAELARMSRDRSPYQGTLKALKPDVHAHRTQDVVRGLGQPDPAKTYRPLPSRVGSGRPKP